MVVLTALLHLALACTVGIGCTRLWRDQARSAALRRWHVAAPLLAMLISAVMLVLHSAAMAEAPLLASGEAVWSMLSATHLGLAWWIGLGALSVAAGAACLHGRGAVLASLAGMAVFCYSRSMVSHAASQGDISVPMLADWVHLMSMAVWTGAVIAGALVSGRLHGAEWPGYGAALSRWATIGLCGVVLSGVASAWHNLGGSVVLPASAYGAVLVVKLMLVAVAVALGAYNRFAVLPLLSDPQTGAAAARRFRLVLRIEALVLCGVLVAAAVLSSTAPLG